MLRAPLDLRLDSRRLKLGTDLLNGILNEFLPFTPLLLYLLHQSIVCLRFQVPQAEILKLCLNAGDAEAIGERRIDFECLPRDALAFVLAHILQRAHIVQAISELNHDDADVLRHSEKHLAVVLEFDVLLGHGLNAPEFRHAVDERHDVLSEYLLDLLEGGLRILHHVVQERCAYRLIVKMECRKDIGDVHGVDDIWLARDTFLSPMGVRRKFVGAYDFIDICVWLICGNLLQDHIECHGFQFIRHLLPPPFSPDADDRSVHPSAPFYPAAE